MHELVLECLRNGIIYVLTPYIQRYLSPFSSGSSQTLVQEIVHASDVLEEKAKETGSKQELRLLCECLDSIRNPYSKVFVEKFLVSFEKLQKEAPKKKPQIKKWKNE